MSDNDVARLRRALAARERALGDATHELVEMRALYAKLYNLAPVGHVSIDNRGEVLQTNDLALALLHTSRDVLYGKRFEQYVAPVDREKYARFQETLFASDAIQIDEVQLRRSDGGMFFAELRGRRMGEGARGFIVVADVSERRQMHEALVRSNRELAALNQFARAVSDAFDIDDVTANLEALLTNSANIAAGAIFVLETSRDFLQLARRWGDVALFEPLLSEPIDRRRLEASLSGQEVLSLETLREHSWLPEKAREQLSATRPAILAPMVARGNLEGVIWLFGFEKPGISPEWASYVLTLAQQAAVAMRGARLFANVHESQARLRLLTREIVSAQEEERRRVARELHDETGQLLTALKFNLEMLGEDLKQAEGYEEALAMGQKQLEAAIGLSEETMAHIRRLVHNLRPTALDDLGLNSALEGLCHDFSRWRTIEVDYHYGIDETLALPEPVQLVAYRFLQEALTNVSKHARATRVDVSVERMGQTIRLTVEDDGVGFDARTVTGGFGILGMRERLESVGGRLEIASQPNDGTRLVATVPVDQ